MTHILQSIRGIGRQLPGAVHHYMRSHPYLSFFFLLTGFSILSLAAIYAACAVVLLPLAWLCGWL